MQPHAEEPQVNDEVEYQLGANGERTVAVNVRLLKPGTVALTTELVEKDLEAVVVTAEHPSQRGPPPSRLAPAGTVCLVDPPAHPLPEALQGLIQTPLPFFFGDFTDQPCTADQMPEAGPWYSQPFAVGDVVRVRLARSSRTGEAVASRVRKCADPSPQVHCTALRHQRCTDHVDRPSHVPRTFLTLLSRPGCSSRACRTRALQVLWSCWTRTQPLARGPALEASVAILTRRKPSWAFVLTTRTTAA